MLLFAFNSGVPATQMIYRMGWHRGDRLGHVVHPAATIPPEIVFHKFTAATAPEMFQTFVNTRAVALADFHRRLKRDKYGFLASVQFLPGETLETSIQQLRWEDIVEALVTMTNFGFVEDTQIDVWDDLSSNWIKEFFHWSFFHVKLSTLECLPVVFQDALRSSGKESLWTDTLDKLLQFRPFWWKWSEGYCREYKSLIGTLWKTLEVALNSSHQPLESLFFLCNSIMTALDCRPCGDMTFVPLLGRSFPSSTNTNALPFDFVVKVRYRAQGRLAVKRYRNPTRTQGERGVLQRRFFQAPSFLPHVARMEAT